MKNHKNSEGINNGNRAKKMNAIPVFPDFLPISITMAKELHQFCSTIKSGVSEFTFANLYIDTLKYGYQVSRISEKTIVVCGISPFRMFEGHDLGGIFFFVLGDIPSANQLDELFARFRYWKNMPQDLFDKFSDQLFDKGFQIMEDRDNFDYLYLKTDLAALQGKDFHKKKNLLNAFCSAYTAETKQLDIYSVADALSVLESWKKTRNADDMADYAQCRLALEQLETLGMGGIVAYADGVPVGFSLGETICEGTMFVVVFEKGINSYKGVYQFVNRSQAINLPGTVKIINREQDLGNPGLRQAKMTYRPCGFTKKYLVLPTSI